MELNESFFVGEASAPILETNSSAEPEFGISEFCSSIRAVDHEDQDDDEDAMSVITTTTDRLLSGDPPPYSEQRTLGLNIVRHLGWSGSKVYEYDIITVHGIRDVYKTAWIDNDNSWWVRSKLFNKRLVRQIDYSYEISEESGLYTENSIRRHAEKLIAAYSEIRGELEDVDLEHSKEASKERADSRIDRVKNIVLLYGSATILEMFLGTPHQCKSIKDLEDQILQLIQLPGPHTIKNFPMEKANCLASQVNRINQTFSSTKLIDRAVIFNIFTQTSDETSDHDCSLANDRGNHGTPNALEVVTPFRGSAHSIGLPYAAAGVFALRTIGHLDLIKGGTQDEDWPSQVSALCDTAYGAFKINPHLLPLQTKLLSIAPPTQLSQIFCDQSSVWTVVLGPIKERQVLEEIYYPTKAKIMHLHSNGDPVMNISEISRRLCAGYNVTHDNCREGHR
ncbi:uncharacterized protein TRIVIDRAFT_66366 [Trichoderma virens Gv29-8]|uniref:Uncharacterized protein n=1 Tax=Hypocrea virens (strain Gv29-8 / FGSC 10586) TaxID=413071 RepID=G9N6U7_HYPVG|nr:uncharacterized protein TRIVIDRAFT_66366 [Trichoderma virens Gv29-8]EHK17447.1 hypothetical protein TRIVIDRAFT_66366 [Trichoderma virens Gv29-8]UKZ53834.1 hypothetical protein TrVGV298_007636 [Trichoderma virens]